MKSNDQNIENDIRLRQSFSIAGAISREGGDFLKGGSPVPLVVQAQTSAKNWLRENLHDTDGALLSILFERVNDHLELFAEDPDHPLEILKKQLLEYVNSEGLLIELVRKTDVKYGQIMNERPIFQKAGEPGRIDDPYTHEGVKETLLELIEKI